MLSIIISEPESCQQEVGLPPPLTAENSDELICNTLSIACIFPAFSAGLFQNTGTHSIAAEAISH